MKNPKVVTKKKAHPVGWTDSDGIFDIFRGKPEFKNATDQDVHASVAAFMMLNIKGTLYLGSEDGSAHFGKPINFSAISDDDLDLIVEIVNRLHDAGQIAWDARKDWLSPRDFAITALFYEGLVVYAEQITARALPLGPSAKPASLSADGVGPRRQQ